MIRAFMHRRQVKRLYFHARELADIIKNAKADEQFLSTLSKAERMTDAQLAESYLLYLAKVTPAAMNEIILAPS